jgi:hypothetical protein
LTLTENLDEPEWSAERFLVTDNFYHLEVAGDNPEDVVNHLKGVILCAVGQRTVVPDEIKFFIERN